MLAKSQIATRRMGLFIHALTENACLSSLCEATKWTERKELQQGLWPQLLETGEGKCTLDNCETTDSKNY